MTDVAHTAGLLDQVRGVLFSRSNVGEPFLVPVSTLAVRYALVARRISNEVRPLLNMLLDLRDVQDLPRGHWLPVSTRCVPCGECALLVSGTPTDFLRRDYGVQIGGEGLGRLLIGTPLSGLPSEPLTRWLGSPASSLNWCDELLSRATFGDSFGWQDLHLYDHWSSRSSSRWKQAGESVTPDGPILARSVQEGVVTGYYLLLSGKGSMRGMYELGRDFESRRFALAMLHRAGNGYGYSLCRHDPNIYVLKCPYLPVQEERLLRALGPVEETGRGLLAYVPSAAVAAVEDVLKNLGLTPRGLQDG